MHVGESLLKFGCDPRYDNTVNKFGDGLKEVKTNLRFFGLSQSFYSRFQNNLTEAELKNKN